MTHFVFKLASNNIFHSDLKPANFVLKRDYQNVDTFTIKIVDIGYASFDYKKVTVYTKNYTCAIFN